MDGISRTSTKAANRRALRPFQRAATICIAAIGVTATSSVASEGTWALKASMSPITTSAASDQWQSVPAAHPLRLASTNLADISGQITSLAGIQTLPIEKSPIEADQTIDPGMRFVEFGLSGKMKLASPDVQISKVKQGNVPQLQKKSAAIRLNSENTSPRLLGSHGRVTDLTPVSKRWGRITQSAASDLTGQPAIRKIIAKTQTMRPGRQLAVVNREINRMISYRDDMQVWRKAEYWATPMETVSKRAGDCEDFAILKYWTLRSLGVAASDMRIVVLRDKAARNFHAVLAVAYNDDWLILDNRFSRVRLQRDLPNYQPLYSLNETAQWAHVRDQGNPVRLASRLNLKK